MSFLMSKYIAGWLILILVISQTIHVELFPRVEAKSEQYRDIVSIFVDNDTYATLRPKIKRYSEDVQGYLGDTRVSLFVVDSWINPAQIATKNEKLYYEWDGGDGISRLVGTILIWNISIPMVSDEGSIFPSLYPYVDFVDKAFVYDDKSALYKAPADPLRKAIEAEIWHGVISPSVWRSWDAQKDKDKISAFLDKTHNFYTKTGKFVPTSTPPRVFYYDGEYESESVNFRSLFQYALSMSNAENIAYKRFTKYLLKDINGALLQFDASKNKEQNDYLTSLGIDPGWNGFDDKTITEMQDIHTKNPIMSMLKDFQSIINKNTLSEALANIHNAGRYNSGTTIRADLAPLQMTVMDEIARSTLKEANSGLMDTIDGVIGGLARKIPIAENVTSSGWKYDVYFFGQKSSSITNPSQCSIARGSKSHVSQFWKDVLIEANVAYDVNTTEAQAEKLKVDTEELVTLHKSQKYMCFDTTTGKPKIDSYWWWNTLLRVVGSQDPSNIMKDPPGGNMKIKGFSENIFSLGGMIETTRLSPPSIADCMDSRYQYGLKTPYKYSYNVEINSYNSETITCTAGSPKEWNTTGFQCPENLGNPAPRYTCITEHDTLSMIPWWTESINYFQTKACLVGTMSLNGAPFITAARTCSTTLWSGEDMTTTDTSIREDVSFRTIPSILRHVSPTDEEIQAAEANGVTPSLPVDMIRYVEFLTPKWNIVRLNYPNFFEAPAGDALAIRAWLKWISETTWNAIIAQENNTSYTPAAPNIESQLVSGAIPSTPIDWNNYISDATIDAILRARNWLTPDVTKKYKTAIETSLSYSREYTWTATTLQPPKYPIKSGGYDIAYLGLAPFVPASKENIDPEIANISAAYDLRLREINGLNISEPYKGEESNPYGNSDECWPPEWVDIFAWPGAIMCWIRTLLPPRIMAGSCSSNSVGSTNTISRIVSPPPSFSSNTEKMKAFYEWGKLYYTIPRTSMKYDDSMEAWFHFAKDEKDMELPPRSIMRIEPVSLVDETGKDIVLTDIEKYINISPRALPVNGAWWKVILSSKSRKWTLNFRAILTIVLPDGSVLEKSSDVIKVKIRSEYLEVSPKIKGIIIPFIDVTNNENNITFDIQVMNELWASTPPVYPIRVSVIDDISGVPLPSFTIGQSDFILPKNYIDTVGIKRFTFEDKDGRSGETTLATRAGNLSKIVLNPVSTMLKVGSTTLMMISLEDSKDYPISPDLHTLTVEVSGGYIRDASGQKKTTMTFDTLESNLSFVIWSDTVGSMQINVTDTKGIKMNSTMKVIDGARAILSFDAPLQVGWKDVTSHLKITDTSWNELTWFRSVVSLQVPEEAWLFPKEALVINNGKTETFIYSPGKKAWKQKVKISIPGLWDIEDAEINLQAWVPLYISADEWENDITFRVNDRYGNIVESIFAGTLRINTETLQNVSLSAWVLKVPKKWWYYTLTVPSLESSEIYYTDASGNHSVKWIPYYAHYVVGIRESFDFLPDYNARYTVLYGESYLREWEDILYNSDPNNSQSLAVSTLLDSPYKKDIFLSVSPGGNVLINHDQEDVIITSSVVLEEGYPLINFRDSVKEKNITKLYYPLENPILTACGNLCNSIHTDSRSEVKLTPNSSLGFTVSGNTSDKKLELSNNGSVFLSVDSNGKITPIPGVSFEYSESELRGIGMTLKYGNESIWNLYITTRADLSPTIWQASVNTAQKNTPYIDANSSISYEKTSFDTFGSGKYGYTFFQKTKDTIIDETKVWPSGIDSFGETRDNPGIWWKWKNTTLLSYAWGDTVGEATKWFHTYTLINMWDPVAHVDNMAVGTVEEWIDRSIWTRLTSSISSSVVSYSLRDMDKDGLDDIVTVDGNGAVSLILNMWSRFRTREQIAYLGDLLERGLFLGNFTWDGYADILSVDNKWNIILVDNNKRRFSRQNITIDNGSTPVWVTQFKIYDMDNDGKDDVVVLTEWWELSILYGTSQIGTFHKVQLESTLWITLSNIWESHGWAIKFDGLPQIPSDKFGVTSGWWWSDVGDSVFQSEVYYQHSRILSSTDTSISTDNKDLEKAFANNISTPENSSLWSITETYIKSQYAPWYNLEVTRTWKNLTNPYISTWDRVRQEIVIKNTGDNTIKNINYLDTLPSMFDSSDTKTYDVVLNGEKVTRNFSKLNVWEYDASFLWVDIPAGASIVISFELRVLPTKHGNMMVWKLEWWESWDDIYGDIWFEATESCGADIIIWRSESAIRTYTRWTRSFSPIELPESLKSRLADSDKNSIPDSIENMTPAELTTQYKNLSSSSTSSSRPLVRMNKTSSTLTMDIGFDDRAVENIESMMQDFFDGLSCGFGWGSCMSFPINWAPLAPGSAPTIFWFPIAPLIPETGVPLFSGITWVPIYGPWWCFPVPAVFPASPIWFSSTCTANLPSPGWMLGNWDPTNAIRIYVTPTLTLGMWAALCFSWPANATWRLPPPPLFGLVQWGNCIVMAKAMPFCKWDWSRADGNVKWFSGLGSTKDVWNAASCQVKANTREGIKIEDQKIRESAISYIKNPTSSSRSTLYNQLSSRSSRNITLWPAIRIWGSSSSSSEVGIEIDTSKPLSVWEIVKVKNGRVPAFPDLIMDWVTRQSEEIVNALFTAPSLVIIWPWVVGSNMQFDGNWKNFQKRLSDAYSGQSVKNLQTEMGKNYDSTKFTDSLRWKTSWKSALWNSFQQGANNVLDGGIWKTLDSAAGWLASVQAAYKLIGQLPFLNIRRVSLPIDIPWANRADIDKYAQTLENYSQELDRMMSSWCVGKSTKECADEKIALNSWWFMSSLQKNIRIINDYKKFPEKLQKYVTWKQRYMSELLCNVETVRQVLGGWIKDNGVRFKKWAELFVLLKAIAESWQPILDVFSDTSKQCGVCRNQKYDSTHWKFKLLSAIIPSPPIIRFPRWPDIVLDISDIRLGINISVPDFVLNVKPIRFPSLPSLSLPSGPSFALSLPSLPTLPALPSLPDLPSLPSLPKLALPNLPPPPKVPKLLSSIAVALKIFKLVGSIHCFLSNTFLVPEWEVGDVIAKRTERQGKLSFDFLGIKFPEFTLPSIREIKVSTHVNFELRSEFITEFAKQAVKPINEFTSDLGRWIPKKIAPDVRIWVPQKTINLTPWAMLPTYESLMTLFDPLRQEIAKDEWELLVVEEFQAHLISELEKSWQHEWKEKLLSALKKSDIETSTIIATLTKDHNKKYDTLIRYIQSEHDDTAWLQNVIDLLQEENITSLSFEERTYGKLVSREENSLPQKLLDEYTHMNERVLTHPIEESKGKVALTSSLHWLLARLDRLALGSLGGTTSLSSAMNIPNGYMPNYQGIYILTPSWNQTRLFDYNEDVDSELPIEAIDIDKDSDKDYLFVQDGALYIKYSGPTHRSDHKDTTLQISSLTVDAPYPNAPNFFHEIKSTPKTLSLTFTPASSDEKEWRMSFYDRYLEWDMLKIWSHDDVDTQTHVIDFYREDGGLGTTGSALFTSQPILRSLLSVSDPDSFSLLGPKITVLSWGVTFSLPVGRTLYTGSEPFSFLLLDWTGASTTLTLDPYTSYKFSGTQKWRVTNGKAYSFGMSEGEGTYPYSDDYRWMPLIAEMRLISSFGSFKIREHTTGNILVLPPWGSYMLRSLGERADSYSTTITYPNGNYSARLTRLDPNRTLTDVILLSPQMSADSGAPIIDFPDTIRVPVYAQKTYNLHDFISEMHTFNVMIDGDIRVDDNKNGIADDDFSLSSTWMKIEGDNLIILPHESLDTTNFIMRVRDEVWNTSYKVIKLEIYSPIPEITNVTSTGWTMWQISETINEEPIHIFRARQWSDITMISPDPLFTHSGWNFMSGSYFTKIGAIIENGVSRIAVSENGVITGIPPTYSVSVKAANTTNPMKFILEDDTGKSIYEQSLVLPEGVDITTNMTSSLPKWELVIDSPYQAIKAAPNDPSIPSGWYITDGGYQAVLAITQDGNIYILSSQYSLSYGVQDDFIRVSFQQWNTKVGSLSYKTAFFYTLK